MTLSIIFPDVEDWVREHCNPSRSRCLCGRDLRGDQVHGYPHDACWETDKGRMWLYIPCPKCGYEMALWKIGVPRDQNFRAHRFTESELCDLAWVAPDQKGIIEFSTRGRSR